MADLASKFTLSGEGAAEPIRLACGEQLVGSLSDAAVHLPAMGVARMHATLWVQHDAVYVTDLGSEVGTRINAQPITEGMPTPLELGDEVQFGDAVFTLDEGPQEDDGDLDLLGQEQAEPEDQPWTEEVSDGGSLADLAFLDDTPGDRLRSYFNTFCRFCHLATSTGDRHDLLEALLEATSEVVMADRYLVLLGDSADSMKVLAARQLAERTPEDDDPEPPSGEFIRQTLAGEKPVSTFDALADERFSARDSVVMHGVRSAIGVRLAAGGQTLGMLYLDSQSDTGLFGPDDAELIHTLGNVASLKLLYLASRKALLDLLTKTKDEVNLHRKAAVGLAKQVDQHVERLDEWLGHDSHPAPAAPAISEMRVACAELRTMVAPFIPPIET